MFPTLMKHLRLDGSFVLMLGSDTRATDRFFGCCMIRFSVRYFIIHRAFRIFRTPAPRPDFALNARASRTEGPWREGVLNARAFRIFRTPAPRTDFVLNARAFRTFKAKNASWIS